MAAPEGIEPSHGGIKTRCLPTWLQGYREQEIALLHRVIGAVVAVPTLRHRMSVAEVLVASLAPPAGKSHW